MLSLLSAKIDYLLKTFYMFWSAYMFPSENPACYSFVYTHAGRHSAGGLCLSWSSSQCTALYRQLFGAITHSPRRVLHPFFCWPECISRGEWDAISAVPRYTTNAEKMLLLNRGSLPLIPMCCKPPAINVVLHRFNSTIIFLLLSTFSLGGGSRRVSRKYSL